MACHRVPARYDMVAVWSAASLLLLLSGCSGYPSVLAPASEQAGRISGLFWGVFAIAAAIFLVTEGLLIIALVRFRNRPGAQEPDQVHGNLRLEVAWTLAPAVIMAGVFAATFSTMYAVAEEPKNALQVRVIGHQWWWEIQYPTLAITTATDLHVPEGQPVLVELVSDDVIHSFWVPELAGKVDVLPGHRNRLVFAASRSGTFRGQCAEYCGAQHANMGLLVIAEPQDQFQSWAGQMRSPASTPTTGSAEEGRESLLRGACVACHTIGGTAAQGKIGPDLTHFGSRRTVGALTLDNTPENLAAWLQNTQAIKPGVAMPGDLGLTPETIRDMVTYLESLK